MPSNVTIDLEDDELVRLGTILEHLNAAYELLNDRERPGLSGARIGDLTTSFNRYLADRVAILAYKSASPT